MVEMVVNEWQCLLVEMISLIRGDDHSDPSSLSASFSSSPPLSSSLPALSALAFKCSIIFVSLIRMSMFQPPQHQHQGTHSKVPDHYHVSSSNLKNSAFTFGGFFWSAAAFSALRIICIFFVKHY